MSYFPLFMDMDNKPALIIGGGNTALRKAKVLLSFGAYVKAISPEFIPEFYTLAQNSDKLTLINRHFTPMDIDGIFIAVSATDDRNVNKTVSTLCQNKNIPVNVVDDISLCTFIFPAVIKEEDVVIGISSGGKSPVLTQYVKEEIKAVLPSSIGEINTKLGEIRTSIINSYPPSERKEMFEQILSCLLTDNNLTAEEIAAQLKKDSDINA